MSTNSTLPIRSFQLPQSVITGSGASLRVGEEGKKLGVKKALIVTDRALIKLGMLDTIFKSLEENKIPFSIFDRVTTEPTDEFIYQGFESFREHTCDCLIAVGGGSPIDTAKAISMLAANPAPIERYQGLGKIPHEGPPVIAMPTTAGTGSEVTPFTIITDTKRDVKMLIGSPRIMPRIAIVDPLLTVSTPKSVTAATGIDALTHAIEAYVSIKAQPLSDIFCLSAIKLISGNLKRAWDNGNDIGARENTMLGALQAGIAFSNSSVALVHGMARPIGAHFHVSHGASNAALLGAVMEFSISGNPGRYAHIAGAIGLEVGGYSDAQAAQTGAQAVKKLIKDVKIPSLRELGLDKEKLQQVAPRMADDAIASGSPANNPRIATKEEIINLYLSAYEDA